MSKKTATKKAKAEAHTSEEATTLSAEAISTTGKPKTAAKAKAVSTKPASAKTEASKAATSKTSASKADAAMEAAPKAAPPKAAASEPKAEKPAGKTTAKTTAKATSKASAPRIASGSSAGQASEAPRPRLASGSSGPTLAPLAVPPPPKPKPQSASPAAQNRAPAKAAVPQNGFKVGDYIVYPAHGVGQILAVEKQEVAGFTLELFVINFLQDKMTLKVPMPKVLDGAIRKLSDPARGTKALDTLTGRARVKRTMWSRRAQEYEAKINSGDLVTIAEVVRDLYRSETQPEQSYSERQLYEAALDRMAREIAVVRKLDTPEALKVIEEHLKRGPRRGAKASDDDADASGKDGEENEAIGEAA